MGIDKNTFGAYCCSKRVSSSDLMQNDQRSARSMTVIARMPEDRLKTINNREQPSNTFKAIYT
eukprot:15752915-Heterocapsa_arctica.AAC.1